jgi:glycosyltransferase involved in cell wall biosynthesis
MTVAHIIGIFSPEHGGPVVSLRNYVRGQTAGGLSVRIRTVEGYPDAGPAIRLPAPIDQKIFPLGWPTKLGRSPEMAAFLRNEGDADIYHLHGAWLRAMYYGFVEARRRGRPFLVEVNGSYQPFDLRRKSWRKHLVRMWFQDRMFQEAACLHVNSVKEANDLRDMGFEAPMVVIPAGFDFEEIDMRLSSLPGGLWPELANQPFFLYLARIHPSKGIGLLLDAWKELEAKHKETVLVIVGSGEPSHVAGFREQARRLGIEHRCVWKGFVSEDEKIWAYARANFYCLPSYTENFGNTVQEALGIGTAVLTTTGTPWTNLGDEGCGWVADCEPSSITASLERALRTPLPVLRDMGRTGRTYIQRAFSLDSVIGKQIATYRWLLGGAAPTEILFAGRPKK